MAAAATPAKTRPGNTMAIRRETAAHPGWRWYLISAVSVAVNFCSIASASPAGPDAWDAAEVAKIAEDWLTDTVQDHSAALFERDENLEKALEMVLKEFRGSRSRLASDLEVLMRPVKELTDRGLAAEMLPHDESRFYQAEHKLSVLKHLQRRGRADDATKRNSKFRQASRIIMEHIDFNKLRPNDCNRSLHDEELIDQDALRRLLSHALNWAIVFNEFKNHGRLLDGATSGLSDESDASLLEAEVRQGSDGKIEIKLTLYPVVDPLTSKTHGLYHFEQSFAWDENGATGEPTTLFSESGPVEKPGVTNNNKEVYLIDENTFTLEGRIRVLQGGNLWPETEDPAIFQQLFMLDEHWMLTTSHWEKYDPMTNTKRLRSKFFLYDSQFWEAYSTTDCLFAYEVERTVENAIPFRDSKVTKIERRMAASLDELRSVFYGAEIDYKKRQLMSFNYSHRSKAIRLVKLSPSAPKPRLAFMGRFSNIVQDVEDNSVYESSKKSPLLQAILCPTGRSDREIHPKLSDSKAIEKTLWFITGGRRPRQILKNKCRDCIARIANRLGPTEPTSLIDEFEENSVTDEKRQQEEFEILEESIEMMQDSQIIPLDGKATGSSLSPEAPISGALFFLSVLVFVVASISALERSKRVPKSYRGKSRSCYHL